MKTDNQRESAHRKSIDATSNVARACLSVELLILKVYALEIPL
jgi:hypothetical protein